MFTCGYSAFNRLMVGVRNINYENSSNKFNWNFLVRSAVCEEARLFLVRKISGLEKRKCSIFFLRNKKKWFSKATTLAGTVAVRCVFMRNCRKKTLWEVSHVPVPELCFPFVLVKWMQILPQNYHFEICVEIPLVALWFALHQAKRGKKKVGMCVEKYAVEVKVYTPKGLDGVRFNSK